MEIYPGKNIYNIKAGDIVRYVNVYDLQKFKSLAGREGVVTEIYSNGARAYVDFDGWRPHRATAIECLEPVKQIISMEFGFEELLNG